MEQIISYLIPAVCIAYITYIWTDTNAFYDYFSFSKMFRKIPIIKEYEKSEYQMEFPMFLKQKESFFMVMTGIYFYHIVQKIFMV